MRALLAADPATHPERLIPLDHPAVRRLATASGETGVAVCFCVAERSRTGEPHITQVVAAGGRMLGIQRKRHLGEGEEAFTAATGTGVLGLAGARFGVASVTARLPDWREGVLVASIP